MCTEDQAQTIEFLGSDAAFGPVDASVAPVVTHISSVLLIGTRAIKLKRAVRLPYVDFSTPELRLAACEHELDLNRRTAPTLYRAVRRVTRGSNGGLELDGPGALVDAVVEMERFDADCLFDRMARDHRLTPPLMTRLATGIARFHAEAPIERTSGGSAAIAQVLAINEAAFALTDVFDRAEIADLNAAFRSGLAAQSDRLNARTARGRLRHCHGDLHLRNICLLKGEPTLFDCIEFDDALATTDVLYDLAFLLMDLWHRDLQPLANLVFNRYFDALPATDQDDDGLPLLPYFMALRAAVRAHVTAAQVTGATDTDVRAEAEAFLCLSRMLLIPRAPRLVAVGGFSGSGKSTMAAALAPDIGPAPGARILSSDRVRKAMFGVAAETRLPPEAYAPVVSNRVYAEIAQKVADGLAQGHGVVADAVFDRPATRDVVEAVALQVGVPFTGLWLDAETDVLVRRVEARQGDASDATADVVRRQVQRETGDMGWTRLAATGDAGDVRARARRMLGVADRDPAVTGA